MIKLSICIPTYNFGKFIGQTLDSIIPNLRDGVEVIVLDGGSTDDTANTVAARQHDLRQLTYYNQGFRGGIDRDIEKVVSLAQGKYCWLFSADDIMLPGAIDKVIDAIKSNDDIYLCEHILCSLEMHPICTYPPFKNISNPRLFNLEDISQRKEYFRSARTSEAFFSFMSSPIFKKAVWDEAEIPESFRNTCWIVAGHLLSMIQKGITVNFIADKLLYKRGDNDSFSDNGTVNRLRISVEGLAFIGETVFGVGSPEALHIKRVIRNEWTLRSILPMKLLAITSPQQEDMRDLNNIVATHYLNAGTLNFCKYTLFRLMPIWLIRLFILFVRTYRRTVLTH